LAGLFVKTPHDLGRIDAVVLGPVVVVIAEVHLHRWVFAGFQLRGEVPGDDPHSLEVMGAIFLPGCFLCQVRHGVVGLAKGRQYFVERLAQHSAVGASIVVHHGDIEGQPAAEQQPEGNQDKQRRDETAQRGDGIVPPGQQLGAQQNPKPSHTPSCRTTRRR